MITMKDTFIQASKYREMERTKGTLKALESLAQEIGSCGNISLVRTPLGSAGAGRLAAMFVDVNVIVESSERDCTKHSGGTLRGLGNDIEEALSDLLKNLLTPENSVPASYDKTKARLGVGVLMAPLNEIKTIKVVP